MRHTPNWRRCGPLALGLLLALPLAAPADELTALRARLAREPLSGLREIEARLVASPPPGAARARALRWLGADAARRLGRYRREVGLLEPLAAGESPRAGEARRRLARALFEARWLERCAASSRAALARAAPAERPGYRYLIGASWFRLWRFEAARRELTALRAEAPRSREATWAAELLARIDPPLVVGEGGLLAGYEGKYLADPRWRRLIAALPAQVAAGRAALERATGLRFAPRPVLIEFVDAGAERSWKAILEVVGVDGTPRWRARFASEHAVLDPASFERRLRHELVHALLRDRLGQRSFELPVWFREGLALQLAGQAEARVAHTLSNQVFAGRPLAALADGLERDPQHSFRDYAEDALAVGWLLRARGGAPPLPALLARLVEGASFADALEATLKRPYAALLAEAERRAAAALAAAAGEGAASYLRLKAAAQAAPGDGLAPAVARGLTDWLDSHGQHPLAPNARLRLARSQLAAGQPARAEAQLEAILSGARGRTPLDDDAAFWRVLAALAQGDATRAGARARRFLRDYSWSRHAAVVRRRVAGAD